MGGLLGQLTQESVGRVFSGIYAVPHQIPGTQPEGFPKNQGYRYYDNWKGFGCNLDTVAEVGIDVKQVDEISPLYWKKTEEYWKSPGAGQEENIPVLVTIAPYVPGG